MSGFLRCRATIITCLIVCVCGYVYYPLICMFHNRTTNEKINKQNKRSLRILYKDDSPSFNELLKKDESVTMHVHNIQLLVIQMYKVNNNLCPS